jgi:hypothetical protein
VQINADMTVEELIEAHPQISQYLAGRGIVCVRCGEPYWGTLRELAAHKGLAEQIDQIVDEIIESLIPEPHDQTA